MASAIRASMYLYMTLVNRVEYLFWVWLKCLISRGIFFLLPRINFISDLKLLGIDFLKDKNVTDDKSHVVYIKSLNSKTDRWGIPGSSQWKQVLFLNAKHAGIWSVLYCNGPDQTELRLQPVWLLSKFSFSEREGHWLCWNLLQSLWSKQVWRPQVGDQ